MIRRDNPRIEIGILFLIKEIIAIGVQRIPIATLSFILFQTALFMDVINVPWTKLDVCVSPDGIIHKKNFKSLILSSLEHGHDMHLYYNMASFLIKGYLLEARYGSLNFTILLFWLMCTSNTISVILNLIYYYFNGDPSTLSTCAIGFSGVIFALKVIFYKEETENVHYLFQSFRIPGGFALWAELILIHITVREASFSGHLAGILTGLLYSYTLFGRLFEYVVSTFTRHIFIHNVRTIRSIS